MNLTKFKQLETLHEDKRNMMYLCPAGKHTVGIGHNLDANPISDRAVDIIFEDDVNEVVIKPLNANLPWWTSLDEVRQLAVADMCFNMGWTTFSQFKNFFKQLQEKRYADAASNLESTRWYGQVGSRAKRIVNMIKTGELVL